MKKKLKRRISYQWRLFLPLVIVLWALLIGLAGWQYAHERNFRRTFVEQQLKLINTRIIRAINNDNWENIQPFKRFVSEYYETDSLFDDVHMTIYDRNWTPYDSLGHSIHLNKIEKENFPVEMFSRQSLRKTPEVSTNQYYYYMGLYSDDGNWIVVSALPNDIKMREYIGGSSLEIWIIVFVIAIIITIAAYITTKHLARNINILHDFANRSANDPWFEPGEDFPHDELGDIARQIVHLYQERTLARQEIEREHQLALYTLEEKGRQKRQMTNNINHELKTPIGVIKGYLDTIIESPDMDEATRRHFIEKAREHANRLTNLIADVSAITRLEEGESQINTECLDFHELVYMFANDARESGILGHFSVDIQIPLGVEVNGNGSLLVGLLMNLTKNAVNYSGGNKIRIEYRGEDKEFYHFSFSDNGNGVPQSSLQHLFDRFYRIDSGRARKSGGTGLGLAIVFNTIKAHGGSITAINREDGGLEFDFTLRKWKG